MAQDLDTVLQVVPKVAIAGEESNLWESNLAGIYTKHIGKHIGNTHESHERFKIPKEILIKNEIPVKTRVVFS